MKIIFTGSRQALPLNTTTKNIRERRVLQQALSWSKTGHSPVIVGRGFKAGVFQGVAIAKNSLFKQADIFHINGLKAVKKVWLKALLFPEALYIWTCDELPQSPSFYSKIIIWQASKICDAVIAPTREIQYKLRVQYGVSAEYIPDGYRLPALKNLPPKHFNLRKNQYVLAWAGTSSTTRVKRAYKGLKTRKPLVFIDPQAGDRAAQSLIANCAVLVLAELAPIGLILSAMAQGRAIAAATAALHEETLGVAARFFQPQDTKGLHSILASLVNKPQVQKSLGAQALKRAVHFQQKRVISEYRRLVQSLLRFEPAPKRRLDAVIPHQEPIFTRRPVLS